MGLSGPSDASGAHVVLEHVDEGGVEFAAGMVVWREGLAPVGDLQLLASLSAEEVQAPRLFGHGGGAVVLARLSWGGWGIIRFVVNVHVCTSQKQDPRTGPTCTTRCSEPQLAFHLLHEKAHAEAERAICS